MIMSGPEARAPSTLSTGRLFAAAPVGFL